MCTYSSIIDTIWYNDTISKSHVDITDTCLNSRLCCGQAWASAPRISSWNHCYFHISWEHVTPNTLNYVQAIVNLSNLSHVVACLAIATGVKTQWHLLAWATPTWRRHHETCVRQKKNVPIFLRPGPSTCIKWPHHLSRHSCIWVGIWDQDDLSLYKKHCNPLYQPGVTVWFVWSVSIARVDSGRLCRPVTRKIEVARGTHWLHPAVRCLAHQQPWEEPDLLATRLQGMWTCWDTKRDRWSMLLGGIRKFVKIFQSDNWSEVLVGHDLHDQLCKPRFLYDRVLSLAAMGVQAGISKHSTQNRSRIDSERIIDKPCDACYWEGLTLRKDSQWPRSMRDGGCMRMLFALTPFPNGTWRLPHVVHTWSVFARELHRRTFAAWTLAHDLRPLVELETLMTVVEIMRQKVHSTQVQSWSHICPWKLCQNVTVKAVGQQIYIQRS